MTILATMIGAETEMESRSTWTFAEAEAKFGDLVEAARAAGPQTITQNGYEAAVVVSVEAWERKARRTGNLAEFFAASPLVDSDLKVERVGTGLRAIEVSDSYSIPTSFRNG